MPDNPDPRLWPGPPAGWGPLPAPGRSGPGDGRPGTEEAWPGWLRSRLWDRRLVVLRGVLDDDLAGRAATEMMTLDATGDGAVTLHVDATGDSLEAAFTIMDTIDLLGVPVHAVCLGRVEGTAVGVVAACHRRTAAPHTRFLLTEPQARFEGRASQMEQWLRHHEERVARFAARLAQATGRPAEHVEADLAAGRWLSATEALDYRLVDDLWTAGPGGSAGTGVDRPSRPFGFQAGPA
ncbi:MAG: ATP-dependent Clp protease proteolytic subunit [Acidimicrobiales bacterium]